MDAVDLLNSDVAELPKPKQNKSYSIRLETAFSNYVEAVKLLRANDYASQEILAEQHRILDLSKRLLDVHRSALQGRFDTAQIELKEAMETVAKELNSFKSNPLNQQTLGYIYRLRVVNSSEKVDRGGIFHIPFDRRHLVAPRRYSIAGLPMLYAGSSLLVCWEEMGRPSPSESWVSAMRLKEPIEIRILNFGYRPALLAALLDTEKGANTLKSRMAVTYAILWPIIAACSFHKTNEDAPFIEEYVLPQLIIAYIREGVDFDGLRYFSNRVNWYDEELKTLNFVFPSQPKTSKGYCPRLSSMFEITSPIRLSELGLIEGLVQGEGLTSTSEEYSLQYGSDPEKKYEDTNFGKAEAQLISQPFGVIQ